MQEGAQKDLQAQPPEFVLLPQLASQSFELTLELLVGLLLLIEVSLQLLLAVLKSVYLLLGLVHLSLQCLQTQI